jgi:hypothetical protein
MPLTRPSDHMQSLSAGQTNNGVTAPPASVRAGDHGGRGPSNVSVGGSSYAAGMAIARIGSFVLDCPDPAALASFYGGLLDWKPDLDQRWAEVRSDDGQSIAFQQVDDYTAPDWPGQGQPQQVHLDVEVDDLDAAEAAVLGLGATKHEHQPGTTFRVFLDPAGHPFCLCKSD